MPTKTEKTLKEKKAEVKARGNRSKNKCPKCRVKYKDDRKICSNCGANSKKSPALVAEILRVLRLDYPITKACDYAGITKQTFFNWVKSDQEFADRVRRAKYFASDLARNSVIKKMANDGHLALKYLERKEKDEFSTKQYIQEQAAGGELDLDEKKEMLELLKQEGYTVKNIDDLDEMLESEF